MLRAGELPGIQVDTRYAALVPTTGGCGRARCQHMHHYCHSYSTLCCLWTMMAYKCIRRPVFPSIPSSVSYHLIFITHTLSHSFVPFQTYSIATSSVAYSELLFSRCTLADTSSLWASSRLCPSPKPYRHLSESLQGDNSHFTHPPSYVLC